MVVDLSIIVDEDSKGHGIIDGECPIQRLAPSCWHGHRLSSVHDNRQSGLLLLSWWWVVVHLSMSLKHNIVDDVDMEYLIQMPIGLDPPIGILRGQVGEKRLGRLVVVELSWCVGQN
jgi:hypothetical protein